MEENVKLTYNNKTFEFPLVKGSQDEYGVDITKLRAQTGLITLDPGFKNTGSCQSDITFLDGEKGILRYRGYDIEDLADNASFIEVAYLLIFGDLPSKKVLKVLEHKIHDDSYVDEDLKSILKSSNLLFWG